MDDPYPYDSKGFLWRWLVASVLVWPLALILGVVSGVVGFSVSGTLNPLFNTILTIGLAGGTVGIAIGLLQRNIIDSQFDWEAPRWLLVSMLGGLLGGLILLVLGPSLSSMSDPFYNLNFFFDVPLLMPLYMLPVSAAQWWALRYRVEGAWLWVLANGVGGLVWSLIVTDTNALSDTITYGLLATLAQGAITGGALLWLFQTARREAAPSPVAYYEHVDEDGVPL